MSASLDLFISRPSAHDLRDEVSAARVLLIEDSLDSAALVERVLTKAERGDFSVKLCPALDAVEAELEEGDYDVLLVDVTLGDRDPASTLDTADALSHRLPVIVLTGTQDHALEHQAELHGADDQALLERVERSELTSTILHAVRRHRRIGAGGNEPIICRVPEQ